MRAMTSSWVFTSATLAVGGDFSHFRSQLGLEDTRELQVDSPFDYRHNALLYLPENLPEPQSPSYTEAIMHKVIPVLEASQGRAFLLFTSHRALHEAARLLENRIDYPILVQGQMPKRELVEAFQSVGNAILLGTSSFWEGVDVRGEALSLVVIDKLPFGSPGDPVMSARIDHMKKAGGNPFFEYQVPQAAIALKQGVGRLIRDVTDRGVLVLCDPRIRSRNYGEIFITSLPPMPITRDLAEVQQFYRQERESYREDVVQS
jgi:ATP-dependent DNA helicase DinG